jgi:hypothetical protein
MAIAVRRTSTRTGIFAALVVLTASAAFAQQTSSPADGPWSGQAQCVLTTSGPDYQEEQTHTWRITGDPPRVTGSFRHWPAVWSVQGRGSRTLASATRAAQARLSSRSDTWTIAVAETSGPLSIWEVPATNRVRIGSQHGLLVSAGAIKVKGASGPEVAYSIQEWTFPAYEDVSSNPRFSGTRTRTLEVGPAWRAPRGAVTTETCTWSFTNAAAVATISSGRAPGVAPASGAAGSRAAGAPVSDIKTPGAADTARGAAASVPARAIPLSGFTAAGSAVSVNPRTLTLAGFTASGAAVTVPPRKFGLEGWTASGEATTLRGLKK